MFFFKVVAQLIREYKADKTYLLGWLSRLLLLHCQAIDPYFRKY